MTARNPHNVKIGAPVDSRLASETGVGKLTRMPLPPHQPNELLQVPFRGTHAIRDGLITRDQLRSSCWLPVIRDVYIHRSVPLDTRQRAFAVACIAPQGAVVSGRSAAWLHGVDIMQPGEPIEITLPRGTAMRPRADLSIRRALLPPEDVTVVADVPVTTPLRTSFDLARRPYVVEAVAAVDALAHARLIKLDELLAYAPDHRGWRGVRQIPHVVDLSEPEAESPMESRTRMVIVLAGLPRPEVQLRVYDEFGLLQGRLDMGYRKVRTGIEYDGEHHRSAWEADIRRQNALRASGWTLLRYTASDVYRRPQHIVQQVAHALRRS